MSKVITIISKEVGKESKEESFVHSLENMQKKVGGSLDAVSLPEKITMWVHDEGLLLDYSLNLIIISGVEEVAHIVGNVFFTSIDETGETVGLEQNQLDWLENNIQLLGTVTYKDDREPNDVFGLYV